jgi:tetratricopeptide (TPR) repeat protein
MKKQLANSQELINLLGKANELRRKKDYKAAITLYLESVKHVGESAELCAVIAGCYFAFAIENPGETGQNFENAISWIEKAIKLAPDSAYLHTDLAQYYSLGVLDYEKAAQEYRIAIDLAPKDVVALVGAASLYGVPEGVVALEEAINWLEQVTQLDSRNPNHFFRLGQLYYEAGCLQDAVGVWFKALVCPRPLDSKPAQTIKTILSK